MTTTGGIVATTSEVQYEREICEAAKHESRPRLEGPRPACPPASPHRLLPRGRTSTRHLGRHAGASSHWLRLVSGVSVISSKLAALSKLSVDFGERMYVRDR
jgi:hypothetical protein